MRDDFAKQLTERERFGHLDHFHNYRRMKMFDSADGDGPLGGREPMKARYRIGYGGKSFNENLNPLRGWLRSIVGQKWDKCYSELRQKFDARSVINDHILQHLYQYLETKAYVNAQGKVVVLTKYRWGGQDREVPIAKSGSDFYVCPKDGTVKLSKKPEKRSVIMQRAAEQKRKAEETYRVLDAFNILRLIEGVWYHFEMKQIPQVESTIVNPNHDTYEYNVGYGSLKQMKTWDLLNERQRERFGRVVIKGDSVYDTFHQENISRDQKGHVRSYGWLGDSRGKYPNGMYHATKNTANKKQLRDAGL